MMLLILGTLGAIGYVMFAAYSRMSPAWPSMASAP